MYSRANLHTKPAPTQPLVTMVTREMVHSKYLSHTQEDRHHILVLECEFCFKEKTHAQNLLDSQSV